MSRFLLQTWPQLLSLLFAVALAAERILHFRMGGPRSGVWAVPFALASLAFAVGAAVANESYLGLRLSYALASCICGVTGGLYASITMSSRTGTR